MNRVFVLDSNKQQLAPCTPRRAKLLLKEGKAAVFRKFPFTIILKKIIIKPIRPLLRLKLDPGSNKSGIAIVNDSDGEVIFAAEIEHRGFQIRTSLETRRSIRSNRRQRKTRYRKPRFSNRRRPEGWIPPSLGSRISNIVTWVGRLLKLCPISAISQELVRFDTQLLQNPEISGLEYQQGDLAGYEVREYLLEKFGRRCAYCKAEGIKLEIDHIVPRSRGGTDRVSNLTLACHRCNQQKGNRTAQEFGHAEVEAQAKVPLKDAAAVNTTRLELYRRLQHFGLPIEVGTGGKTKFNRVRQGLPKKHWIDAACVGASTPEVLKLDQIIPLEIRATGHGSRQMCSMNRFGFPRTAAKAVKSFQGFQTGDIVRAKVPAGKYRGKHIGRVAIRSRASFGLNGFDVHPKYLTLLHKCDGYELAFSKPTLPSS